MNNNKGFVSIVVIGIIVLVVAVGGSFGLYYFNSLSNRNAEKVIPSTTPFTSAPPTPTSTGTPIPKNSVATTTANDSARAVAISKIQLFLTDWENKYKTDCKGKETTSECIAWKSAILKMKNTCFQSNLKEEEVNKCGNDIVTEAFLSGVSLKGGGSTSDPLKSNIDSHGTDLSKLPDGKTVKVFKSGPIAEVSYRTVTTVTYVRTGDSISITENIVADDGSGSVQYKSTVTLAR